MTSIANMQGSRLHFTLAGTDPVLYLDTPDPPSGSVESLVGHIYNPVLFWQESRPLLWGDFLLSEKLETITDTHAYRRAGKTLHESVSFYADVAGLLDLHDKLLPVVYALKLEQSRRVTEILFTKKLVKRLD